MYSEEYEGKLMSPKAQERHWAVNTVNLEKKKWGLETRALDKNQGLDFPTV